MENVNSSVEQFHRGAIDGSGRGAGAVALRAVLSGAEPFYSAVAAARNGLFRSGVLLSTRIDRPVISVGNITTGGTGKTPVVRWLVQSLRAAGRTPAVLMRGYKARHGQAGDEQRLLQSQLPDTIVEANPSRIESARRVSIRQPGVDVFVLDDGFQHRRIQRDIDLVLIDATNPFGHGHVLPRGLLREPLSGLRRADAFLITHADAGVDPRVEPTLARYNPAAPAFRCRHVHRGLLGADGSTMAVADLAGRKALVFCGIGNPAAFVAQIRSAGAQVMGAIEFADHHHYTGADLTELLARARKAPAEMLITTEKDWVKLWPIAGGLSNAPPIWRTELGVEFENDDEAKLLEVLLRPTISRDPPAPRGEGRSPAGSQP